MKCSVIDQKTKVDKELIAGLAGEGREVRLEPRWPVMMTKRQVPTWSDWTALCMLNSQ